MELEKPFPQNLHRFFEDVDEVAYFEANVNYTLIHLKNGKKHLISYTLKRFEEMLSHNHNFTRIHRSFIVNNGLIKKKGIDNVLLKSGLRLPVSRRRRVVNA